MDYTGNSSKRIVLATGKNNGLYWQSLKQWIILATAQNNGL